MGHFMGGVTISLESNMFSVSYRAKINMSLILMHFYVSPVIRCDT